MEIYFTVQSCTSHNKIHLLKSNYLSSAMVTPFSPRHKLPGGRNEQPYDFLNVAGLHFSQSSGPFTVDNGDGFNSHQQAKLVDILINHQGCLRSSVRAGRFRCLRRAEIYRSACGSPRRRYSSFHSIQLATALLSISRRSLTGTFGLDEPACTRNIGIVRRKAGRLLIEGNQHQIAFF